MKSALLALLLAGCAAPGIEGVTISNDERAECAASHDCTVWSKDALQRLIQFVFDKGRTARQGA